MIARIIHWSMHNRVLVLLLAAALVGLGVVSIPRLQLDAIPDLSDVQVIVVTDYPGQNPEVVEDQVTYPLTSALLSVPGATVVRGISMFELSFVYVLFADGTDLYWARSRVLEYLNFARKRLPSGVEPALGPDASGVGWVLQYALHPGHFCPEHPAGIFQDPDSHAWYAERAHAPPDRRDRLTRVRALPAGRCPLSDHEGHDHDTVAANQDLGQLRSLQDWYLRFPLAAVEGVSEVAAFGGFVQQYQVVVDPQRLQAHALRLADVRMAIQRSNDDIGGSVIEQAENELMVRARGYLRGLDDLAKVPLGVGPNDAPILLGDVATVQVGGQARRGLGDYDGRGDAVGGIIVARHGSNAWQVIQDSKARLLDLEAGLPPGVEIRTTYDRSALIGRAVETLRLTLLEEILVVGIVCILFLVHARSELVAVCVVPASVILALLAMHWCGFTANIMSLGGIAIAIGVIVDSSIVMVENAHKHLDRDGERVAAGEEPRPRLQLMYEAAVEVGPQLFFSLLIITVSFLPVFALTGESGRLFQPLAWTKTFAMAAAALLSITVIPVLMVSFISARVLPKQWGWRRNTALTLAAMTLPALALWIGLSRVPGHEAIARWWALGWMVFAAMLLVPQKIVHEEHSPLSRLLQWLYEPAFRLAMRHPVATLVLTIVAFASTWYPATRLGTEFMPPLDEGDLLYMPTTDPSVSVTKAREILQQTDKLIRSVPEVRSVHGKMGRADTATDPAPLSMVETVVQLETDRSKWRTRKVARFFDGWPAFVRAPLQWLWPGERPITMRELKFGWQDADGTMHAGINDIVRLPGIANAWPYPIENRITMLATGIKTAVGLKFLGPDLAVLDGLAERAAVALRALPGTVSAYAEKAVGGYYLDIDVDRLAAARYGLTVGDVQDVIATAIGGMDVSTYVSGLERYGINLRYARDLRDDVPALREVLVPTPGGAQVPLGQLAELRVSSGPPMVRSENAQRSAWVVVETSDSDLGGYVAAARAAVAKAVPLPARYSLVFAGQYELWTKALPRLYAASALALVVIVLLLYLSARSWFRVAFVLMAVPFSLIGALWFLHALDFNISVAVIIGMIALAGLDAETGMVMLLYLDTSLARFRAEGRLNSVRDLWFAVHDGAVKRIRPKAMTVASTFVGLVPLLWATGSGADVMRRLAAPMIGGLTVSFLMELLVYPVVFYLARRWSMRHELVPAA